MKKSCIISSLTCDKIEINDPQIIVDKLNKYFSSVGDNLAKGLDKPKFNFNKFIDRPNLNTIYCEEITEIELLNIIRVLKSNKSPGFDDIGPSLVKECAVDLLQPLKYIFNLSLTQGTFPDRLKIAKIIPIHKKGSVKLVENYRPISLLSIFDKIFEKIVYSRIIEFLNRYEILYPYQFGFRAKHSTTLALIELIDTIYDNLDKNNTVIGVFIRSTEGI